MSRHPYFASPHTDYPRRPYRSQPINITQPTLGSVRPYAFGARGSHSSPSRESDTDRNHPRRRIAVACSRCRKRKIKCSGDPGNGQGCNNCKNAAADPGACQFLRVNSRTYECSIPEQWPYQHPGFTSTPPLLNQLGPGLSHLSANNYSMPSLCSSSYPGAPFMPRGQISLNSSGLAYQNLPARTEFCTSYSASPLDGAYDSYGVQTTPYILPVQEAQAPSTLFGSSDHNVRWSSLGHSGRSNNGYDQELPTKYTSSNMSYGDASLLSGLGSADPSSTFGLGALANSLPLPNLLRNSDRILPSLGAGRSLSSVDNTVGSSQGLCGEPASFLPQQGSTKSNVPWGSERTAITGGQTPKTDGSSSTSVYSMTATDGKPSVSPQDSQQTAFGYLEHTPPTGSTTPTTDYNGTNVSTGATQNQLLAYPTYDSGLSSEALLRRDFSSPNLYTYSSGTGSKDDPQSSLSDGTLLNGQPYTRIRQPQLQTQQLMTYDSRRRGSSETGTRGGHRTSIASAASSRR